MKTEDKEYVIDIINDEGLSYAFECYSDFKEIKDEKFHELRLAMLKAMNDLKEYIGHND